MAMQREGSSEERPGSGRRPQVIEGEAREIAAEPPAQATQSPGAADEPAGEVPPGQAAEAAGPDAPSGGLDADGALHEKDDAIAAPPSRRKTPGWLVAVGIVVAVGAGAVAWLAGPGRQEADQLRAQVTALIPEGAQRLLGLAPAANPPGQEAAAPSPAQTTVSGASEPAGDAAPKAAAGPGSRAADSGPDAAGAAPKADGAEPKAAPAASGGDQQKTAEAGKPTAGPTAPGGGSAASSSTDAAAPAAQPSPASPQQDTAGQSGASAAATSPSTAAGGRAETVSQPPPAAASPSTPSVAGAPAAPAVAVAETARVDALAARIDAIEARSKASAAPVISAVADLSQRVDTLAQRLAAVEAKLDAPKTNARATQEREVHALSDAEGAASRAVVAQALVDKLRAGAPVGPDVAALRNLGVADDQLAALAPFAEAGPPTPAQLAAQWQALRAKIVAVDAPAVGTSFADKLVAQAKGVFRITWAGEAKRDSARGVFDRVSAALQRGDMAGALAASGDLPAAAKPVAADWRAAVEKRMSAETAARAVLANSIAALGRPKTP